MTETEIVTLIIMTIIAFAAGYCVGHDMSYRKGRRKGLHDGWVLAQGGKISPGLTALEVLEMPMVFPDKTVYRDGKLVK